MPTIQRVYPRVPQKGYPGRLAKPNAPHYSEEMLFRVPTGGTNGKPGYLVYLEGSQVQVADATNDDHHAIGVISPELTDVAGTPLTTVPHNSPQNLEYTDGMMIQVLIDGISWAKAGTGNFAYGQQVDWDHTNFQWNVGAAQTTIASNPSKLFFCVSQNAIAQGDLFLLYSFGYFRKPS